MPTNILRSASRKPAWRTGAPAAGTARHILLRAGRVSVRLELLATPTADRIWAALPVHSTAETWGAEVYFHVPVSCTREESARDVMQPGELAYWPDGEAIALGFGQTPVAT